MDRISDDDLLYHARVIAELRAAQVALDSWARHLTAKYQIGPSDAIAEDGTIQRGPADES